MLKIIEKILKSTSNGFILFEKNKLKSSFKIPAEIIEKLQTKFNSEKIFDSEEILIDGLSFSAIEIPPFTLLIKNEKKEYNFYKEIFESAVLGIYRSTPGKGQHLMVNPELVKIYGYDNEEDLKKSITSIKDDLFVSSDRREELLKILKMNGKCSGFESEVKRKNGEKIWISENARAVFNKNGEIETIIGTVKDITVRKEIENKLRLISRDWERTFNAIEEAIIILNNNNIVTRLNNSCEYLGLKEGDNLNKICDEIFNCSKLNCESCIIKNSFLNKKVKQREFLNTKLNKVFQVSSTPIIVNDNFEGTVIIIKDATELKRLEEETKLRLQELVQSDKLKSLGEMVANMAHEINNPNTYINYNSEELEINWKLFKPYLVESFNKLESNLKNKFLSDLESFENSIISIKNGSKRISSIIDGVKNYVRAEQDEVVSFDPNSQINQALSIINPYIKKSTCKIIRQLDSKVIINGYPNQFEQVVVNLILNSIRALNKRDNKLIRIITEDFNDGFLMSIYDNGIGINKNNLNKIFEPFYTTYRNEGGTGLGLSISYQILKNHNATLNVISVIDKGTSFKIYLGDKNYKRKIVFVSDDKDELEKLSIIKNKLIDYDIEIVFNNDSFNHYGNLNLVIAKESIKIDFPFVLNYSFHESDLSISDGTNVANFDYVSNYNGLSEHINNYSRVIL